MANREPEWKYVWGIGWYDPDDMGVIPKGLLAGCSTPLAIIVILVLVVFGTTVVEWAMPWLPWLG